jgi:hypothetical protein
MLIPIHLHFSIPYNLGLFLDTIAESTKNHYQQNRRGIPLPCSGNQMKKIVESGIISGQFGSCERRQSVPV